MCRPAIPTDLIPQLFIIETNLAFTLDAVGLDEELVEVGMAFGLTDVQGARRLNKPSPTSRLYRLHDDEGRRLMIRGIPVDGAKAMEAQCDVARGLNFEGLIHPLTSVGGPVLVWNKTAWMAYEPLPGEIYDGGNCEVGLLLDRVFALQNALARIKTDGEIPKVSHRSDEWPTFYATGSGLFENLDDVARTMMTTNRDFLVDLSERVGVLAQGHAVRLVHNDLNHANVLIHDGRPAFLDLEDLVYEMPEVSVVHGIFKLMRHGIYRGCTTIDQVRATIPGLLNRMAREGYAIPDRDALFQFGALRILSEIHTICMWVEEKGDKGLLYDLEKKIHNLFELWILVEPDHGFSA